MSLKTQLSINNHSNDEQINHYILKLKDTLIELVGKFVCNWFNDALSNSE
jgi:hypothetical protein